MTHTLMRKLKSAQSSSGKNYYSAGGSHGWAASARHIEIHVRFESYESTASEPRQVETEAHTRARVALEDSVAQTWGGAAKVAFRYRFDPERSDGEYILAEVSVSGVTTVELLDGEEALRDLLVTSHATVENDFVVICRRI